jgi:hypothetical protein
MFLHRTLVIATKHEKEKVIAPSFEKELGVNCLIPSNFDTDELGTFSGEIERTKSPLETAREKCFRAMEITQCDLAIASEGSFGPHPTAFFAHADDELLLFIDKKNDLEIAVRNVSLHTNFNAQTVTNLEDLRTFATKVKFPSHGIILKNEGDLEVVHKGITDWQTLEQKSIDLFNTYQKAVVETDMRALYNPTRLEVIAETTQQLISKIKSLCPKCNTPGFGIVSIKSGLKCEWCGSKTRLTLSEVYKCQKCTFEKEKLFPNGVEFADPMYCDNCNP